MQKITANAGRDYLVRLQARGEKVEAVAAAIATAVSGGVMVLRGLQDLFGAIAPLPESDKD